MNHSLSDQRPAGLRGLARVAEAMPARFPVGRIAAAAVVVAGLALPGT